MRHALTLTTPDGAEILTLSVPTTWDDVSLQQFIDWQCSEEPAVCVLAGITQPQLERLAWADAGYLMNLLAFAADLPNHELPPDLKDPGQASYGQFLLATQHIEGNPDQPDIWYAPYLYALYRSREVYGRLDEEKISQMEAAILQEPVSTSLNLVLFFSAAWLLSTNGTAPNLRTLPSPTRKSSTPAWRNWGRALARCLRWTRWPRRSASLAGSS